METNGQKSILDDQRSDVRSFGSNCNPCSQSRKISIGIMVDPFLKARPEEATLTTVEKPTEGEVSAAMVGKRPEAPEQVSSPWVSTRTSDQKKLTSEAGDFANYTSNLTTTTGMHKVSDESKEVPTSYSVQLIANQMSILQSGCGKLKKLKRVTYNRKGEMELPAKRVEEFSFATMQEVHVPEKEVEGKSNGVESRSTESLRVKLWEILGSGSLPIKQFSTQQVPKEGANNSKPELKTDKKENNAVKFRQNSDTIESDSESPNTSTRRPVTRSLTRKRAPAKVQLNKIKNEPSSRQTQKNLEKNLFPFEKGWSDRPHGAASGGSLVSKRKKCEGKGFSIKPRNIFFPQKDNADDIQQAADRSKGTAPAEKTSSLGNKIASFHSCSPKNNCLSVGSQHGINRVASPQSPVVNMTDRQGDTMNPVLSGHTDRKVDRANPSLKNIVDLQPDIQCPTFEMRIRSKISSLGSLQISNQRERDYCSPADRVSKSLLTSKPDYHKMNAETESSHDAGELEDSPIVKSVPIVEDNNDAENFPYKAPYQKKDFESPMENSPISEGYDHIQEKDAENRMSRSSEDTDCETPENASPVNEGYDHMPPEQKFVLHPNKRPCIQEGINANEFSPTLDFPEGEKCYEFQGLSEQNQDDGLASVIALFTLALERVKSKIKSMTSKKSAEILMSVAEAIHSHLHNAESQIQTDVRKLTSLSKSKRKRLETRFQEQQEQLRVIHEKFKEEISQHIQNCRSTLEGLEAHRIECKGTVDKQKSSQRKLLLQAEAAIETQLNDAQRRITAVHELAREKMLQLKYVISECLKEGILS